MSPGAEKLQSVARLLVMESGAETLMRLTVRMCNSALLATTGMVFLSLGCDNCDIPPCWCRSTWHLTHHTVSPQWSREKAAVWWDPSHDSWQGADNSFTTTPLLLLQQEHPPGMDTSPVWRKSGKDKKSLLTVGALFQCFIFQAYGWNWMTVPLYSFLSLFLVAVLSHAKYIFNEHVAETDNFKLHLRE